MRHCAIKLLTLTTLFVACAFTAQAKIKVVEKSAKSEPIWLNTTNSDYIITTATAPDLTQAQNMCMSNVREEIIGSVAQNVETQSTQNLSQQEVSGEITSFLTTFTSSSQSESAKVPFLTGISISKVEDSYWEKRLDTDTGTITYICSIKYPFSSFELKKLILEFDKRDKNMSERLEVVKAKFDTVSSVAEVDNAVMELKTLVDYFFDSVRRNEANNLMSKYSAVLKSIYTKEVENKLGEYRFKYQYDGRDFAITSRPTATSETLYNITLTCDDSGVWSVKYKYDTCEPDEENSAVITSRIKSLKLTDKFYANIKGDMLQITPSQTVYLSAKNVEDGKLQGGVEIRMNLKCNLTQAVTLYDVTLNVPGLSQPLFVDNIRLAVSGVGEQSIVVTSLNEVQVFKSQNNKLGMLTGSISLYDTSEKLHKINVSLPFRCNW